MQHRVRRQGGGNGAGTANKFGKKKTNNPLRHKTCPGVDVTRCCGKESAVKQGVPEKVERARPRGKMSMVGDPVTKKCTTGGP